MVHKIYLYKKQDHLENGNKMQRAVEKPEETLLTTEYLVYRSQRWTCRMHSDTITSQSWSRCSRNISRRNNSLKTWVKKQEINRFSEKSQKLLDDMNQRTLREFWQTSISWLQCLFTNRDHLLQLREKFEVQAESYNNPGGHFRLYFNPWLWHEEEIQSRTETRCIWKTSYVFQGEWDAYEGNTRETWEPSDDCRKMVCTRKRPRFVGKEQYWRQRCRAFRSHRSWKTRLYSYTDWTVTEHQTLDSSFECRWAPKASSTATNICRCIKTMPWNARRSIGGNATISETDTSRTKKDEQEILTQPPLAEVQANEERQGNLVQEYEQRFEKLSEDRKFSRLCSEAGLRLVGIGQFLYLPSPRGKRKSICLPRITLPRDQGGKSYRRADPKQCTIWPSLGHKSLRSIRKIQYWSSSSIFDSRSNCVKDKNCERYWQICQRSHADPRGRERFGKTRCKSETNMKTVINKWLGLYSYSAKTMDWHWNRGIQGTLLFSSVKIHHSTTSIQSKSLSRRWWKKSNPKIHGFGQTRWRSNSSTLSMSIEKMYQFWQEVEDRRKGFNIAWIRTILIDSCTFEQSKGIQEVQPILHCKTMCCYQKVLHRVY